MQRPPATPTGETFVMCTPKDWLLDLVSPSHRRKQRHYDALRDTIEACGGTLVTEKIARPERFDERIGMYPRDVGIVLPRDGEAILFTPTRHGAASRSETRHLVRIAEKHNLAREERIAGRVEGGNMIYDPTRHVLFVGVSNYHQVQPYHERYARTETDEHGNTRRVYRDPLEYIPEEKHAAFKADRIRHAAPTREWLAAAREQMPALDMPEGEKKLRVVPMFMPDKDIDRLYHLDGIFNILPTGQAIMCPSVMSKTARHMAECIVGKGNIIAIDEEAALRGATNFITVGTHVITPYAPPALKETLQSLGYDVVDPPSVGLPEDAWRFSPGAFVRCATLKMTPDKGFPEVEKNRGATAAVFLPSH